MAFEPIFSTSGGAFVVGFCEVQRDRGLDRNDRALWNQVKLEHQIGRAPGARAGPPPTKWAHDRAPSR